ncbi:MAG: hypothetical protein JXN59_01620 [Anaerolineae bacterium]|nr:hypothetical protein [Anaerolineae bacterium]
MPTFEKTAYKGWQNCYRLANEQIELIVTADVGPRVIHLGLVGGPNMMVNFEEMMGKTGGDEWLIYGGHRLWAAPEVIPRTYHPDNAPVSVEQHDNFVRFSPPVEEKNGLAKAIDIALAPDGARVTVTHRIRNVGVWPIELAVWALSVMDVGGTAILPLPPRGSHEDNLLPVNAMTFWAYSNMADPRWTWGQKYVLLRQDSNATVPQKVGAMITNRWAAYANHDALFVKTFPAYDLDLAYADMGCNVETFTNNRMLELETLSPLTVLNPGEAAEHVETWALFPNIAQPANDADVDSTILPLVQPLLD